MDRPARMGPGTDLREPSPARACDVRPGGSHDFRVDRVTARAVAEVVPDFGDPVVRGFALSPASLDGDAFRAQSAALEPVVVRPTAGSGTSASGGVGRTP